MVRPIKQEGAGIQPYAFLSDAEKAAIVEAIAEHFTLSAATRAALGDMRRYPAVVAAAKSDVTFGLALEQNREVHRDKIRATIAKLALGYMDPLSYRGELTGHSIERHDISALTLLSRTRLPEHLDKVSEQSVSVSGSIAVDDAAASRWVIGLDDLSQLDETEKRQLAAIVKKVQQGRNALSGAEREFAAIAHQPSAAVDAEFEEVASDDPYDLEAVKALA